MKKLLLVLLVGFLGILISCTPDPVKERSVDGTIIAVATVKLNDFDGNYIVWSESKADTDMRESGEVYQVWFIYPHQELPDRSFAMQLTYKWTQRVSGIPVVRVVNLKIN